MKSGRSPTRTSDAELSLPTFRLLAGLVREHAGLHLIDDALPKFERKLRARLFAVNVQNFEEYYRHLKYRDADQREIRAATELLTVHETYFFREMHQLAVLRDEILPQLHGLKKRGNHKALKIWCAGCSTGEEVYTVSMLVHGSRLFDAWDVQIIGSDISQVVIEEAREGLYAESSFRAMPDDYLARFEAMGGRRFRVRDKYRAGCRFLQHNLKDATRTPFLEQVDILLCRNVLIYFPLEIRRQIIARFYNALRPGGYLLLGHAESLLDTSDAFQVASFQDALTYRRPLSLTSSQPPKRRDKGERDTW